MYIHICIIILQYNYRKKIENMKRDLRKRFEILRIRQSARKKEAERKRMRMKSLHVHAFPTAR